MPLKDLKARSAYNRALYLRQRDRRLAYVTRQREDDRLKGSPRYKGWDRARRIKRRAVINDLKSEPCADCGIEYPPYVMDFDHVRGAKLFSLGRAGNGGISLEEIIREAAKCDVVCSNCHRERTFGK